MSNSKAVFNSLKQGCFSLEQMFFFGPEKQLNIPIYALSWSILIYKLSLFQRLTTKLQIFFLLKESKTQLKWVLLVELSGLSATPRLGWGANKRAISGPFQKGKDEIAIQDLNEHVNHIVLQILYIRGTRNLLVAYGRILFLSLWEERNILLLACSSCIL